VMVEKGWHAQNTLGDYHFDRETQRLTRAGELKIRWILTHVPPHRRTVFVVRSFDRDATSMRLSSVQQTLTRYLPEGELPAVVQTDVAPLGRSADAVHAVHEKLKSMTPAPILPPKGDDSSGGQ